MRHSHNFIDLTNKVFGEWTVLCYIGGRDKKWKCKCSCGVENDVSGLHLRKGESSSCFECHNKSLIIDIKGQKFEKWTVLEYIGKYKNTKKTWKCQCECGNIQFITGTSLRLKQSTKCRNCGKRKYYKEISGQYWGIIIRGAKIRNLEFNITKEYVWDLFIKQNKKCALTGLDIVFANGSGEHNSRIRTASLDRIDSSKGYIKGNVQWVHKKINIMKNTLSQDELIYLSKLIAEYNK